MTFLNSDSLLPRLNAVRCFIVLIIAFGYASTMSLGPDQHETAVLLGYEPSWIGIQLLFFFSGVLAYRSLLSGKTATDYLKSRVMRVAPLLIAVTLFVILVIYPVLGKPMASSADVIALGKYFFLTVTCIDPGRPLPGLLDDALYMCLIQGAIWTLRWGLFFHLCVAFASRIPALIKPPILLLGSLAAVAAYGITAFFAAKLEIEALRTPLVGMRLSYVFIIGMAVWAYRNHLPRSAMIRMAIACGLMGTAVVNYMFLPWTTLIEITLTLSFLYGAWLAATSRTSKLKFLEDWPHLALGIYLVNWPTAQMLLHKFPDLDRATLPLVVLPVSFALALMTHYALTGRINQLLTRRLGPKVAVKTTSL